MKTITVLAAILLISCASISSANTNAHHPQTLEELNAWYVEPPAGSNAATYYLQAFDKLSHNKNDYYNSPHLPVIGSAEWPPLGKPLPSAMKSAIANFVRRNEQAISLLKKGAELDLCRYPISLTNGYWTKLPHLARVKQSALILELSAVLHAANRDGREAGEKVLCGLAVAHSLEAEPILISQLVRVACTVITVGSLEHVFNRTTMPLETLSRLQSNLARLEDRDAAGEGFARSLIGERVLSLNWFNGPNDERAKLVAEFAPLIGMPVHSNTLQLLEKNRAADQKFLAETFDQAIAIWERQPPDRHYAMEFYERRAIEATNSALVVSSLHISAWKNAVFREAAGLAYLRLAQTAVALERYRAVFDNYPKSLSQITPVFLTAVPQDPFDSKPLRYRKVENGYVLHSIGRDLKDDSGKRRDASVSGSVFAATITGDLVFTVVNPPKRPQ